MKCATILCKANTERTFPFKDAKTRQSAKKSVTFPAPLNGNIHSFSLTVQCAVAFLSDASFFPKILSSP